MEVSGLRSQVSVLRSQVLVLGLSCQFSVLSYQRAKVSNQCVLAAALGYHSE